MHTKITGGVGRANYVTPGRPASALTPAALESMLGTYARRLGSGARTPAPVTLARVCRLTIFGPLSRGYCTACCRRNPGGLGSGRPVTGPALLADRAEIDKVAPRRLPCGRSESGL